VLNTLAEKFNVSNAVINLTLTSYMICQGLAPTIFGDLADMAGRRPAYIIGFTIYIGANIGIALCNSFAQILVFRCIQSTGSSSTIALGSGVVGDIATSSERGSWMGWAVTGPMISPAVGPVLGGILSQYLGWRSVFWFLVIIAVTFLIPFLIVFPETSRNVVGNGSVPPPLLNMSLLNYLASRQATQDSNNLTRSQSRESQRHARAMLAKQRKLRWPNPLNSMKMLAEKDMGILLFFNAIVFCSFYDVTASAPSQFSKIYGLNDLEVGLAFLPFGAGSVLAPSTSGRLLDWNYRRVARKAGIAIDRKRETDLNVFPIEKARIQVALPFVLLGNAAVLAYGWALEVETHLAVPLIMMFFVGWAYNIAFNGMSTMMVDFYPESPATAIAANNLVRCELGAGATAIVIYMIDTMGRGWCFTFVAGVVTALSPILLILLKWGPKWREERRLRQSS
jgi:MFS family permease